MQKPTKTGFCFVLAHTRFTPDLFIMLLVSYYIYVGYISASTVTALSMLPRYAIFATPMVVSCKVHHRLVVCHKYLTLLNFCCLSDH